MKRPVSLGILFGLTAALGACERHRADPQPATNILPITANPTPAVPLRRTPPPPVAASENATEAVAANGAPQTSATSAQAAPPAATTPPTDGAFGPDYAPPPSKPAPQK